MANRKGLAEWAARAKWNRRATAALMPPPLNLKWREEFLNIGRGGFENNFGDHATQHFADGNWPNALVLLKTRTRHVWRKPQRQHSIDSFHCEGGTALQKPLASRK